MGALENINAEEISMKTFSKVAVGSALVLSLAGAAWAQGPGGCDGFGPMGHGRHAGMTQGMGARIDARLASIKSSLKITSEQETAWKAFETAVKSQVPRGPGERTELAKLSAPERAEAHAKFVQERAQGAQNVAQAVKALYARLSPEQKATADQVLTMRHGRG
jgi:protein CpxP